MKPRFGSRFLAVVAVLLSIMAVAAPVAAQGVFTSPVIAATSGLPGINVNAAAAAAGLTPAQTNWLQRQGEQVLQGQLPNLFATGSNANSANSYIMTVIDQVAAALNMTPQQLLNELQSGKTVAQLAQENNVDLQTQVVQPLLAQEQAVLQSQVQAGTLTQAQANVVLSQVQAQIQQVLQTPLDQLLAALNSINLNGLYRYGLGILQNP